MMKRTWKDNPVSMLQIGFRTHGDIFASQASQESRDCIMNSSRAVRAELHKNGWEEWLGTQMTLPAPFF